MFKKNPDPLIQMFFKIRIHWLRCFNKSESTDSDVKKNPDPLIQMFKKSGSTD